VKGIVASLDLTAAIALRLARAAANDIFRNNIRGF